MSREPQAAPLALAHAHADWYSQFASHVYVDAFVHGYKHGHEAKPVVEKSPAEIASNVVALSVRNALLERTVSLAIAALCKAERPDGSALPYCPEGCAVTQEVHDGEGCGTTCYECWKTSLEQQAKKDME